MRAKVLSEADLTQQERDLPEVLSAFMVLVSVLVPLGILAYNTCKKPEAEPEAEDKQDIPMFGEGEEGSDDENEHSSAAGAGRRMAQT